MREFNDIGGYGEVDYVEHSQYAKAKKVVQGPTSLVEHATEPRTADPINGTVAGASSSITLVVGKSYRVIASTACYFRLSIGASTAVVGDNYLPANEPIIIVAKPWDTLSFIQASAGGIIQAAEVR